MAWRQAWRGLTQDGVAAARRLGAGGQHVSRDKRSEKLGISVGYRSVDGVDRECRWASRCAGASAECEAKRPIFLRFRTYVLKYYRT
jgi:hypothetical protein